MKVREIGEQGLLKLVQRFCPADIVGDDGAVLETQPGQLLVVTTDVLVDGVHFSDRTTSPQDAGWRGMGANLSDLAAMGATPLGITVGLSITADTSVAWVEGLYQGMLDCAQQYDTKIVGGDIVRSPLITVSITAFGQVSPTEVIRRNTAEVGDAIVVTGIHGAARGGLELLLNPELGQNLSEIDRNFLISAHQRPQPRLEVLPHLKTFRVTGMDSSDGLADAILQICRASGVGAEIDRRQLPIPTALNHWVSPETALNWTLYGGEDFELVLCLPKKEAQILVNLGFIMIGTITPNDVLLVDSQGIYLAESLTLNQGFQHF